MHTNGSHVYSKPPRCVCVCMTHDLHENLKRGRGCDSGERLGARVFFLLDKRQHRQKVFPRCRPANAGSCGSAQSPRMWLLIRRLCFELWSLTEEKVGFSGTVSDGPAKSMGKAGLLLRQKGVCVKKGEGGRHGTTRFHFPTPVFHPPLLTNEGQTECEGLRLVCRLAGGFLQEAPYQRRTEIDSGTSWEQWRWHGITNRYEKALTRGTGVRLSMWQALTLYQPVPLVLLSTPAIPPHPSFPFSAYMLWNAKQSGQSPHLGFPLKTSWHIFPWHSLGSPSP